MMRFLAHVERAIDRLNGLVGGVMTLAVPFLVPLVVVVTLLRYLFGVGLPWLSESYVWLNAATFMVGAAFIYREGGHVRVNVIYNVLKPRGRAIVEAVGVVFLLWPALWVLWTFGLPIVERSWRLGETSPTADGLPFLYLLKATLLAFCLLLALQGMASLLRSLRILTGDRA